MANTTPAEVAAELVEKMQQDNHLRHRLDIDSVEAISDTDGAPKEIVAYTTNAGQDVFLKVEFA